jgi:hypothetical protein
LNVANIIKESSITLQRAMLLKTMIVVSLSGERELSFVRPLSSAAILAFVFVAGATVVRAVRAVLNSESVKNRLYMM